MGESVRRRQRGQTVLDLGQTRYPASLSQPACLFARPLLREEEERLLLRPERHLLQAQRQALAAQRRLRSLWCCLGCTVSLASLRCSVSVCLVNVVAAKANGDYIG